MNRFLQLLIGSPTTFTMLFFVFIGLLVLLCLARALHIDVVGNIDRYFHKRRHYRIATMIRDFDKATNTKRVHEKDMVEVERLQEMYLRKHVLAQREIYLMEQLDALHDPGRVTIPQPQTLAEVEEELAGIISQFYQTIDDIREYIEPVRIPPYGPWARDIYLNWDRELRKKGRRRCLEISGCCVRGCRCCHQKRKGATGRQSKLHNVEMHCTSECGCCIRSRQPRQSREEGTTSAIYTPSDVVE